MDARFRRFAFTYQDVELSRGSNSPAGNNGHPYTTMTVQSVGGHTVLKFGGEVRTVLSTPLRYADDSGMDVDLPDADVSMHNGVILLYIYIKNTHSNYIFHRRLISPSVYNMQRQRSHWQSNRFQHLHPCISSLRWRHLYLILHRSRRPG